MTWRRKLSHEEGCRALRTLTERNQFLAASLGNSLTTGTLRFRQDASDSPTTSTKCHQGPSSPLLGKKLKRQRKLSCSSSSDEPLVPRTQAHQKTLTATTRMDSPSDPKKGTFRAIAPNVFSSSTPIQIPRPAIPVVDLTKLSFSSGGIINPPVATSSPVAQPSCSKTIPISIRVDKRPLSTIRVTIQPGAEVVSDSTGLQPVSTEDDHVTESNVTPQSCSLSIKQTPESSPTKTPTSPQKIPTKATEDQDGNESSSSRTSGRSKRQTQLYGSPIRHAVKEIPEASTPGFSGGLTVPVSPAELSSSPSPRRKMKVFKKNKVQPQK